MKKNSSISFASTTPSDAGAGAEGNTQLQPVALDG
jgi:hypothetical protein